MGEEEIDLLLESVQEQWYNTSKILIQKGVQWVGGMLANAVIRGGGLVQWISKNHRINNIRKGDLGQDSFTDLTEQMDQAIIYKATVSVVNKATGLKCVILGPIIYPTKSSFTLQ